MSAIDQLPTVIRSDQRMAVTIVALIMGPIFMAGPFISGLLALILLDTPLNGFFFLFIGTVASAFFAYHMLPAFQWVEVDDNRIRAQRFWNRKFVEHPSTEVTQVIPLGNLVGSIETAIMNQLLGPIRGFEIRFTTRTSIVLIRGDMTNVGEVVLAIMQRSGLMTPPGSSVAR